MKNILGIDTRGEIATIFLADEIGNYQKISWKEKDLSQEIFLNLEKFLKKNDISLNVLKRVIVFEGPGRFTSLRTGINIANTLAFVFKIPLFGVRDKDLSEVFKNLSSLKKKDLVVPFYGKEPRITTPKSK